MFLEQWYDPNLKVKDSETKEKIAAEEVERLAKLQSVCAMAAVIPRRLGPDATSEELAADIRTCKRVGHVAAQCLKAWAKAGFKTPNGSAVASNREAAQVVWKKWWEEHQVWLKNRRAYIATWGMGDGTDKKFAKSAAVRLNNEIGWLLYAMRDG